MSIPYSIFPLSLPGQSYVQPAQPIRGGPSWNVKQSASWNNHRYQSVNGRVLVVKYWNNPLWKWEFVYEQLFDDPNKSNRYYTFPISATDFEILKGFYHGMQGQGNIFAYQPPDFDRGAGATSCNSVEVLVNGYAIIGASSAGIVLQMKLGDIMTCTSFVTSTYLNGQAGTVVAIDPPNNKFTLRLTTSGGHAFVSDTGTATGGQPLSAADANTNSELVHTIGSYPTTISAAPTTVLATEAVQLIDPATLTVYGNGVSVSYTLLDPESTAPYQGYTIHFTGGVPATPVTAKFKYYYPCRFSEDTQEYENFMAMLWACSSVKIDQVRF